MLEDGGRGVGGWVVGVIAVIEDLNLISFACVRLLPWVMIVYSVCVCATCLHLIPHRKISQLNFLDYLKSQFHGFHNYCRMLICGDFSARIESLPKVTEGSSLLPPRHVIDNTTNSQGIALIDFLQASLV